MVLVTNGDDPHAESEISDSFREDTMKAIWHHTLVDPNQPRIKIGVCVCVSLQGKVCVCVCVCVCTHL